MSQSSEIQLIEATPSLPLLPLKDIVVFPHMIVPVFVSEDLCINAIEDAMSKQRKIFLSAFKVISEDGAGLESNLEPPFDVYEIGTICSIMRTRKLPDGRLKVLVQGLTRARVLSLVSAESFPVVRVQQINEPKFAAHSTEVEALVRSVKESLDKVINLGKVLSPDIVMILEDIGDANRLTDLISANLGLKVVDAQRILAIESPIDRLIKLNAFLAREIEVYQMQVRIQSQAKEEIAKMQREHYLREQMRAIKTELGDGDGKDEVEQLWKKMEKVELAPEAREEITRQIKRLERMHQDSSEATLTRTHIEMVLSLPWGKFSTDQLNLIEVKKILDEDHFGLETIKDRIIEFMAVKKLNPAAKSPILCFVGPPGVGKTSLGKSIAKSMNRAFARVSLGGVRDEADIRGHRKTYVGAFPGRIIAAIKQSEASNPVIMLDEIDKLGSDHRGDPSSALLEVLDPEQNKNFVDHYLGVAYDLSHVTFIANANTLDTIPAPLRDRLEIIEVSGYSEEEKLAIANQYLIPKQIKESGLGNANLIFTKPSVATLINGYTRESGLRNLEKQIASVSRKIAREYAEKDDMLEHANVVQFKLTPTLIQKYLGHEKYERGLDHTTLTAGVAYGLAYTQFGGEVLAIETNMIKSGKSGLSLTGQLGDVMKESAQAAFSYLRSKSDVFGFDNEIFNKQELHVHIPAGAIPKDGPSAGISMATSILSAILGKAPERKMTMTGEITLQGKVLPIGGLREKMLASLRENIVDVIIPMKNKSAFEALPANLRKKVTVHFVENYTEVFALIFPETVGAKSSKKGLRSVNSERRKQTDLAS